MSDRLSAALEAIVSKVIGHRIDYLAAYPCRVVKQNADGTLELVPDDARLSSYSKVPIRYGVPGVSATIAAGARVLLEFAGADPQKPIATVWESASVTQINIVTGAGATINIGGATSTAINLGAALQIVARATDPVVAGPFAGTILVPTQTNVKA